GRVPDRVGTLGQIRTRVLELLRALAVVALPVVVALAVDAAPQASLGEELLVDLAAAPQLELRLENLDLSKQRLIRAVGRFLLPCAAGHWAGLLEFDAFYRCNFR